MTADNSTSVSFSDAEILDIANRAATLDERQAISGEPVDSDTMRKLAGERMDWWRRCAAGGNATYFAQRLMEEGLTEADAARMTAGVPDWGDDLPDWASGLNQVMTLLCAVDDNPDACTVIVRLNRMPGTVHQVRGVGAYVISPSISRNVEPDCSRVSKPKLPSIPWDAANHAAYQPRM